MKLTRWYPNRGLMEFHSELDRLFDNWIGEGNGPGVGGFVPAADVNESADGFTMRLDLPGIDPKGVKLSVHGDIVAVRGERKSEKTEGKDEWHRTERVHGFFERSFQLGTPLDASRVKATYQNGVLTVSVPKAESARPREIEIEVSS